MNAAATIPFFVVDAFTETPFAGNPAGVFLDDSAALPDDAMRRLCREVSLESAFVSPPTVADADLRLRYFTAVAEVPLCGHATVAALTALAHADRIPASGSLRVQTSVGVLAAAIDADGAVTLTQNGPVFGPAIEGDDLLGYVPVGPVQVVSTGTPFLLLPLATRTDVDAEPPAMDRLAALSERHGALGVYVFAREPNDIVWSRCFCPAAGLPEDPVTGSASGALGAYSAHHHGVRALTVHQGFGGGRGGTARVVVPDDGGVAVTGRAVLVGEGRIALPTVL